MERRDKAATEGPGKCHWTVGCKNVHAGRTKEHYFKKKGGTGTAEPEITGVGRGRSWGRQKQGNTATEKFKWQRDTGG